jgi:hypothetical protein
MRSFICSALVVVALALPVLAEDGQGWTFSGRVQGSTNTAGFMTKTDPTLGYSFNRLLQAYGGLPFYFVKDSSATPTTTQTPTTGFVNGIGNAYVGLRLGVGNSTINYVSNLEATAPTGNRTDGFSTGRATVDWSNRFSHSFAGITPFANAGLANTVSDTSFFVRPFTSLGIVSHFDGGAQFGLSHFIDIGASAYGLRAAGQQKIFSKLFNSQSAAPATGSSNGGNGKGVFDSAKEVIGAADLANDSGFSTWVAARANPNMNFQIGYTRSAGYDLNTLFFGVAFRVGN